MSRLRSVSVLVVLPLLAAAAPIAPQECRLTVDSITTPDVTDPQLYLDVSGRILDGSCGNVQLDVLCGGQSQTVAADVTGSTWSSRIKSVCKCDQQITVRAGCVDQTCRSASMTVVIPCAPAECFRITDLDVQIPTCEEVQTAGGTWTVTVNATVDPPGAVTGIYIWNFGDNTTVTIPASAPNAPQTTHPYSCPGTGERHVTLTAIGCASDPYFDDSYSETIQLPACGCPTIDGVTAGVQGCDVTFDASLSGPCDDSVTEYIWTFGDGSDSATVLASDPSAPSTTHTYSCDGTYVATLTLGGVGSGCSATKSVDVTACRDCPDDNDDDSDDGKDDGDDEGGGFCGGSWWCCLLWGLLFLALVAALVFLAIALCGQTWAWYAFAIALAIAIIAAILLVALCDVTLCQFLIALAGSGWASYAIICGTTGIIPCTSWLCTPTTIPGTGVGASNLLLIDLAFSLLVALICLLL